MGMVNGKMVFDLDIVDMGGGHLHEVYIDPNDRNVMINRMGQLLTNGPSPLRDGLVQILVDLAIKDDMHPPLILKVNDGEEIRWHCTAGGGGNFEVDIDEYPNPSGGSKTPKKGLGHKDLFKFNGKQKKKPKGTPVTSGSFEDPAIALNQKFYKFSVDVDGVGILDPCIICEP